MTPDSRASIIVSYVVSFEALQQRTATKARGEPFIHFPIFRFSNYLNTGPFTKSRSFHSELLQHPALRLINFLAEPQKLLVASLFSQSPQPVLFPVLRGNSHILKGRLFKQRPSTLLGMDFDVDDALRANERFLFRVRPFNDGDDSHVTVPMDDIAACGAITCSAFFAVALSDRVSQLARKARLRPPRRSPR